MSPAISIPSSFISSPVTCRASSSTRLEQEPCAPLGFIDPYLDEAGGGDVAVLIAHVMRFAKSRCEFLVVLAQLGEHVQGLDVLGVIVQHALRSGDPTNGLQRGSADLADAFRA